MVDVTAIVITGTVFFSIIAVVKIVAENRLRNKLVEKGELDENVKYLFYQTTDTQPLLSLKWGLILVAVGIALLIVQAWPEHFDVEGTLGLMLVLGGLALFVHYFFAQKIVKKLKNTL